ncbi:tetratricopeptide repeat protein [Roseovarius sp. SYSU LYC5161]|uniref:tetratricopeptide repeat protein n=1 Tax=Roseovarius halophilus (ex Wu et al. 2025) TaxID=3376060 RepID=UPI0039997329
MKQSFLSLIAAGMLVSATPAPAGDASGAYLAARQARFDADFAAAAEYFGRVLKADPDNAAILENAVIAYMALGQFDKAFPVARKMEAAGLKSQLPHMALIAQEVRDEAYDAIMARLEDGRGIGDLADGLLASWAELGRGDMAAALAGFDAVAEQRGLRGFAIYHKALALASVGDFEGADAIFSEQSDGPMQRTRRGVIAWAQILSQLDRNDQALALIEESLGNERDPEISQLRSALAAGESVAFSLVGTARQGIAEVFYSLGRALQSDASDDYTLLYSRIAEYLNPDHIDAVLMSAGLLESLQRHELATKAYQSVPRDHPSFHAAELGRAEALRRSGKTDAAVEVLSRLAQTHPDLPIVHVSAGDLYRELSRFEDAASAYDKALALYDDGDSRRWFVLYARGISHERLGEWPAAEADFRAALEINPDQPQVLNYLGYSLVEQKTKLDEALNMIERAAEARPESGYIVDSLGWVLYRLGRYDEAIGHMERAAELMPVDPVVNDHLGDVLWAVGRYTEARFQWKRALSFVDKENPSPDIDPDRIRRKLDIGLDRVLEQEGAPPLNRITSDDG